MFTKCLLDKCFKHIYHANVSKKALSHVFRPVYLKNFNPYMMYKKNKFFLLILSNFPIFLIFAVGLVWFRHLKETQLHQWLYLVCYIF